MNKEITLKGLISILTPLAILIVTWGISINTRMEANEIMIERNTLDISNNSDKIEKVDDKVDQNFKEIQNKLDRIIERLGEKENR